MFQVFPSISSSRVAGVLLSLATETLNLHFKHSIKVRGPCYLSCHRDAHSGHHTESATSKMFLFNCHLHMESGQTDPLLLLLLVLRLHVATSRVADVSLTTCLPPPIDWSPHTREEQFINSPPPTSSSETRIRPCCHWKIGLGSLELDYPTAVLASQNGKDTEHQIIG